MANKELRRIWDEMRRDLEALEIPKKDLEGGREQAIGRLGLLYQLGSSSFVIVYDEEKTLREQALDISKREFEKYCHCVDFSYQETWGKERSDENQRKTEGLPEHLFCSKETDFHDPAMIIYHSFNGLVEGVVARMKKELNTQDVNDLRNREIWSVTNYLDGGGGRRWTHAHGYTNEKRLERLKGSSPLIRSVLLMSTYERLANNIVNREWTSCTRSWIGKDVDQVYVF